MAELGTQDISTVSPHGMQKSLIATSFASLLIFLSVVQPPDKGLISQDIRLNMTDSTSGPSCSEILISHVDVLRVLGYIHDIMANEALDIDRTAKALLYDNLFDLYV